MCTLLVFHSIYQSFLPVIFYIYNNTGYVFNLGSRSPPEIFSTPVHVRLGAQVTIKCKPDRDSISQLTTILMIDPSSSIILRASRVFTHDPFSLGYKKAGIDSTLTSENNLPVTSVNFNRTTLQNAGNYTCQLTFDDSLIGIKAEYNLLIWGVYLFLIFLSN